MIDTQIIMLKIYVIDFPIYKLTTLLKTEQLYIA